VRKYDIASLRLTVAILRPDPGMPGKVRKTQWRGWEIIPRTVARKGHSLGELRVFGVMIAGSESIYWRSRELTGPLSYCIKISTP